MQNQPMTREQMLLRQQSIYSRYGVAPDIQPRAVQSQPRNLSDEIDEDLLFRFGYVPFVIAEVAWDYIDTIFDLAYILKIKETRKVNRALKDLRSDYLKSPPERLSRCGPARGGQHDSVSRRTEGRILRNVSVLLFRRRKRLSRHQRRIQDAYCLRLCLPDGILGFVPV